MSTTPATPVYEIYTDGSLRPPGCGAWATLVLKDDTEVARLSAAVWDTTVSRMELTAILEGLAHLPEPCDVTVYSDSQYCVLSFMQWLEGWERNGWMTRVSQFNRVSQPVKNQDLMQALLAQKRRHRRVTAVWIPRMSHKHNVTVNDIAQALTLEMKHGRLRRTG